MSQSLRNAILILGFILSALWCANAPLNANSITRVGLAHSLAVHGVVNIDEVADYTVDKARQPPHFYCDKAPGLSLLCVPAVWIAEAIADVMGIPSQFRPVKNHDEGFRYALAAVACLLSTSILFSASAIFAFRGALLRAGATEWSASFAAIVLAFGSPLFTWSTAVFGHASAAALLFIAFSFHWFPPASGRVDGARCAIAGLILSLATLVELTALPAAAMIALLLVGGGAGRELNLSLSKVKWMLAGGLGPAFALLVYNHVAFGSPFHLGYSSVQGFEGMKSGFFGIGFPSVAALWGITFGPARGIFWLSPILLFSVPAFRFLLTRERDRAAICVCIAIAIYYLLLNAGYHYWNGGYSLGPRHITPLVPFAMFPIGLWIDHVRRRTRLFVVAAGTVSIVVTLAATVATFAVEDDGRSIAHHLMTAIRLGESDLLLDSLGIPSVALLAVPFFAMAVTVAALLLPRRSSQIVRAATY